jgi:hypothetical protein
MRVRRTAVLMLGPLLAFGLTACGDDDDTTTTTTTTNNGSPTTTDDTTTTTAGETTTTAASGEALGDEPEFHEDGPSGSGCEPGDDTGLPNGWWYGTIDGEVTDSVSFDLACYYTGEAADEVAASRDDEAPSGVYVVNDNPTLRSIPLADDVQTRCVTLEPEVANVDCAPGDLMTDIWDVWIRVVDGEVDRIFEQFHP